MLKLYLVRHGQTEWNVQKRMQGWEDSALTEKGVNNAIALRKKLEGVELNLLLLTQVQVKEQSRQQD